MRIVMLAAENGALPGGKVGGVGDVLRDAPRALAAMGHEVMVVTPAYGCLAGRSQARFSGLLSTPFAGAETEVSLYQRADDLVQGPGSLTHLLLDHPGFAVCGVGQIYCHDSTAPFASDASKFALFCAAVAEWLMALPKGERPDVLHLHDWHSAPLVLLRAAHPRYHQLQQLPVVFTVHNLAMQGVRPLAGDNSSPQHWFPGLGPVPAAALDPRYPGCINLMRCGLRLSDRVHVVSPGYAAEIQRPNDPASGFHGGEGLEVDLQTLALESRLHGILNGCEYPPASAEVARLGSASGLQALCAMIRDTLLQWSTASAQIPASRLFALDRVQQWSRRKKGFARSMVFIGRLTDQKVSLLLHPSTTGEVALSGLLRQLGEDGAMLITGTGDAHYEAQLCELMQQHDNLLYLQGFSEPLAEALYAAGDLFLMPSSFEPCGISQMLAMRAGTPCVVHHVGGLRDTVRPGVDGFAFTGSSVAEQVQNMLACVDQALTLHSEDAVAWRQLCRAAGEARFDWRQSVARYVDELYHTDIRNTAESQG